MGLLQSAFPTLSLPYILPLLPPARWGQAYLTRDFFHQLGPALGDSVLLVTAHDSTDRMVAGALNLVGGDALYGRNWGCQPNTHFPFLHFEACYYQVPHPLVIQPCNAPPRTVLPLCPLSLFLSFSCSLLPTAQLLLFCMPSSSAMTLHSRWHPSCPVLLSPNGTPLQSCALLPAE